MPRNASPTLRRFSLCLTLILLLTMIAPSAPLRAQRLAETPATPAPLWVRVGEEGSQPLDASTTYRTTVRTRSAQDVLRLGKLGLRMLSQTATRAVVLATEQQLEDLARLRFEPRHSDSLAVLLGDAAVGARQTRAQQRGQSTGPVPLLTPAQVAALAGVDADADGLSDTEESWWGTDPRNSDSDGDGTADGAEVDALMDWMGNRRAGPPASGKPFLGWPPLTDSQGYPDRHFVCHDDDYDSVPDLVERWMLGLNAYRESTDLDKFDDGQELFGVTQWGRGALPRLEDTGFIGAEMPSWVKAPGNHPLIAAFPVPEVDVVPSSLHMEAVTTVTTDHTIGKGMERSYSTAKTEGTSTAVEDTITWNEWQEISHTTPDHNVLYHRLDPMLNMDSRPLSSSQLFGLKIAGGTLGLLGAIGGVACIATVGVGCAVLAAAGAVGAGIALAADAIEQMDDLQSTAKANRCDPNAPYVLPKCIRSFIPRDDRSPIVNNQARTVGSQDVARGGSGTELAVTVANKVAVQPVVQVSYPSPQFLPTTTETSGKSVGGARSTTHTQYEEQTVTNGEAFSDSESWGTATAVDSAHAADLWFTYKVRNGGMEYAREIGNLAFNVYLGDDPNPAITYFVAPDLGGDGLFHNLMPGEEHTFTSRRIPLSLEQMKIVDLGGPLRIVVEDYSYGNDELFYQSAANAGVQIALEDGVDDGDESIDNYLLPTWGEETVLDVMARYFPHQQDDDGNLVALWTPEYRSDNPAWCRDGYRTGGTLWCKKGLSTAEWWNIYTNGMGDGSEGFQDTLAAPNSLALFRFNQDSDLDGYSDRSEWRLGTDPQDPASHPRPELLAGMHSIRVSRNVTTTLSLLNTGLYDAYGVEAVMIAPDNTISITNNTVGGSGRVRATKSVVVGSRILAPEYVTSTWQGTTIPASGGYYTGSADRSYRCTVQCAVTGGCQVGAGSWSLAWNDGAGASGTLAFGAGYASPRLLSMGSLGVKLGLVSGSVYGGNTFTVAAHTPRDTFQYSIAPGRESNFTPPLVIVSYNDPQGNHRFIIPSQAMTLADPNADLLPYAGRMLRDPGVEIVTTAPYTVGLNTTSLVVNNPSATTLVNSHLFLEFVDISGTVASEVGVTTTVPAGPSVVPVTWNTAAFSPAFRADQDYIVMAFWTDLQGNILDTAARPLSSFQADPKPAFAMPAADATWSFGTAAQGAVLQHPFTVANTGFTELLTYLSAPTGLSVSQVGSRQVAPADAAVYTVTLNTAGLPVGAYDRSITLRSSDPAAPTRTVRVTGTITAASPDIAPGAVRRPLDWTAVVTGSQGTWATFTHTLGANPQSLQPARVYSQDYGTFWGVGKYATLFGQGTVSYDTFGDGRDGDLVVPTGSTVTIDTVRTSVTASGTTATVASSSGFAVGDLVLIHQTRGTANVGRWEYASIASISGTSWTLGKPLGYVYSSTSGRAQAIKVPQYHNVTVQTGGTLTAPSWDGVTGGIVAFLSNATVSVAGNIAESGRSGTTVQATDSGRVDGGAAAGGGFRGGDGSAGLSIYSSAYCGEGTPGPSVLIGTNTQNGNGGGSAAPQTYAGAIAGGGGGNGTAGAGSVAGDMWGVGGDASGNASLTIMTFGGGGGGGTDTNGGGHASGGGSGGGIIAIAATNIIVDTSTGAIVANGGNGGGTVTDGSRGGGGAGGSIIVKCQTAVLGTNRLLADGGSGYFSGGDGRIRVEYCNMVSGSTNPAASTQQLSCYMVEQVDAAPYASARLNLPQDCPGGCTYQVQYGRMLTTTAAAVVPTTLRLPAGPAVTATMEALVSDVSSGPLTVTVDIGANGSIDWTGAGNVTGSAISLTSPSLAAAFNAYWAGQRTPMTMTLDVPVRVGLSRAGQVLLTNLQVAPGGSRTRTVRLPARSYSSVTLGFTVSGGSGPLAVGVDVGGTGAVAWAYSSASPAYPLRLTSGNLATAVNAYLAGRSGEVAVPIRFYLSPYAAVTLDGVNATAEARPDLALIPANVSFAAAQGTAVTVTATISNTGGAESGPFTVAGFATLPEVGERYIGAALVPTITAGGTAQARILWDTLGYTSTVPVRVVADLYGHIAEGSEANNTATTLYRILSPDLYASAIALSDDQPVVGQTVLITATLRNDGWSATPSFKVRLYRGDPAAGGVLIGEQSTTLSARGSKAMVFHWLPAAPGPQRLYLLTDAANGIYEYNESNNKSWVDLYAGFRGPLAIDSGAATDLAYSASRGYGYLDQSRTDVSGNCGLQAYQTYRRDPGGQVLYRFDHLLPKHAYHLDLILYECGQGAGRRESVLVNGTAVAGPVDLGDGQVHRLSLRLDPALYAGHILTVSVKAPGLDGALVNEIALHDIDYRYADAGGVLDPRYSSTGGYGWLDGEISTAYGTLPYQSARVEQADNELRYRFDRLVSAKRYALQLTFWQPSGEARTQQVRVDGLDTGRRVDTGDYRLHRETVPVPPSTYAADGSIVVGIVRLNATTGAMANEIALEEVTTPVTDTCAAQETPYYSNLYGAVTLGGQPAPAGTLIQAYSPRGDVVGCTTVQTAGRYGVLRVYGEDASAAPPIPGMRAGEPVVLRVNGILAAAQPLLAWSNDHLEHAVQLAAGSGDGQSLALAPGWNLISLRADPPLPPVAQAFAALDGRYDLVLGETGAYTPSLPAVYNTLREIHAGPAYYLRVTGSTRIRPFIEGTSLPANTRLALHAGWNWVGYLPTTTCPITVALSSIAGRYRRVLSLDKSYYASLPNYSTLREMEPGQGYLLDATAAVSLTYPSTPCVPSALSPLRAEEACAGLSPTPFMTLLYGEVDLDGRPAPRGTRVEVLTPRGEVAGCFVVQEAGHYGLMYAYGEDAGASPQIAGFRAEEPLAFRVAGRTATAKTAPAWQDDRAAHEVLLQAEGAGMLLPLIMR